MICKVITRRISKLQLNQQYKQRFIVGLQRIALKYGQQFLNKGLILKKVCVCYLKICEQLISPSSIPSSIIALQFIKSLQLDIYQGESYELYLIKISLHLLLVRCYDVVIDGMGGNLVNRNGCKNQQQKEQYRRKKSVYMQRVRLFCQQLQRSYFWKMLHKDYYSNLQQLHLLILNHQLQKLLHNHTCYNQSQYHIPQQLSQIKNTLTKLYELLKCHILELNQLFFYLQKKVYQILTHKVKLMLEVFVLEGVVFFVQKVSIQLSRITHLTPTYQSIKSKFLSQQLSTIWQKYAITFSKIPNNVIQVQAFQKVQTIINSWLQISQRNYQKKPLSIGKAHQSRLRTEQCFRQKDCVRDKEVKEGTNKSQLWRQQHNFTNNNNERTKTNYQIRKNQQLVDFINFVKEDQRQKQEPYKNYTQCKNRRQHINSSQKQLTQKNIQQSSLEYVQEMSKQSTHKLTNQRNSIELEDQKYECHVNTYQSIEIPELNEKISNKQNDELLAKPIQMDSIKRSNFRVFKDVKNVFEYICQKNTQEPSQHPNTQHKCTKHILQKHLQPYKNIMQNLSASLTSKGFKKLNSVKTQSIKLLQNIKQTQIQRLHRINSVDIMRATQSNKSSLFNNLSSSSKKKPHRTQSLYFPVLHQLSYKKQKSQLFGLPKNTQSQNSNLFIFRYTQSNQKLNSKTSHTKNKAPKPKQLMKIRCNSKKTTLDGMGMDRFNDNQKIIKTDEVIDYEGQKVSQKLIDVGKKLTVE